MRVPISMGQNPDLSAPCRDLAAIACGIAGLALWSGALLWAGPDSWAAARSAPPTQKSTKRSSALPAALPAGAGSRPLAGAPSGIPDIDVGGEIVAAESTLVYATSGAETVHSLAAAGPSAGAGRLVLIVEGDYADPGEGATLTVEGSVLGSADPTSEDCEASERSFTVDPAQLASWLADGVVEARVQNTDIVDPLCSVNRHTVQLRYERPPGSLQFGETDVGLGRTLAITIRNTGDGALEVGPIAADLEAFTPSAPSMTIPPHGAQDLTIRFAPGGAGLFEGVLTIASNDPDTPVVAVALAGTGVLPPVIDVSPSSLEATLVEGETVDRVLSISNTGGRPLEYSLRARAESSSGLCAPAFLFATEYDSGELSTVDLATGGISTFVPDLLSPNGGLARSADGKTLYVAESGSGQIAAVNLASRTVSRIGSGLGFPTGIALDPTGSKLLVTEQTPPALAIVDLLTGAVERVPALFELPIEIALSRAGNKAYVTELALGALILVDPGSGYTERVAAGLGEPWDVALDDEEGIAYVTERSTGTLARIDLATGAVARIASGLSQPSGIAISPLGDRIYVAEALRGTIAIVDPLTGVVTRLGADLSSPLGLLLSDPAECWPDSVALAPVSGTVRPGESVDVTIHFDATGLAGGVHPAVVEVASNDPLRETVAVPVTLTVNVAPNIRVSGELVALESVQVYTGDGALTRHTFPITLPPSGGGSVELVAEGEFGDLDETATASAEGTPLGSTGGIATDCVPASAVFSVGSGLLSVLASDGHVDIDVQNSPAVNPVCVPNQHRVRLRYSGRADAVDFGALFVGERRTLSLRVDNTGSERLTGSIRSTAAEFTPTPAVLDVPPRSSRILQVTYQPSSAVQAAGTMTIASNDPDEPLVAVKLSGTGVDPPILETDPDSLTATLGEGAREDQVFRITNGGGSPLSFTLAVEGLPPSPALEPPGTAPVATPELVRAFAGGEIALLAPSPVPLTCVVEDRTRGAIYAQANAGTGFYRYLVSTGAWEPLASAPIVAGNNGGAALLNGKIYTAYADDGTVLGVYEIATNVWSTVSSPFAGSPTGNIASDGKRYLYLAVATVLLRWDPATGETAFLASAPFQFSRWGGLRYLGGQLFGHSGNGSVQFGSYDVASNHWTVLPPLPGGAVLGAAIDAIGRAYFACGTYGGRNLYRYAIDSASWSTVQNPHFPFEDAGIASMPGAIYLIQGEAGTGFARLDVPAFLTLAPLEGIVPAGGSADIAVRFDSAGLLAGAHRAAVTIASNVPGAAERTIPATLTVIGFPDLAIEGHRVTLESVEHYSADGARTVHALPITFPPSAGGTVELVADGDYGDPLETATVSAEGATLGMAGGTGTDCAVARATFPLSAGLLSTLAADGTVNLTVQNSSAVNAICDVNRHTVRLEYTNPADRIDFGRVPVGQSRSIFLLLQNEGIGGLDVSAVPAGDQAFVPEAESFTIAPRSSRVLRITFTPAEEGFFDSTLVLASNDPDEGMKELSLVGEGSATEGLGVFPPSIAASLAPGERISRTLKIVNPGNQDRAWDLTIELAKSGDGAKSVSGRPDRTEGRPFRGAAGVGAGDGQGRREPRAAPDAASWLTAEPSAGTLPGRSETNVALVIDAAELLAGAHDATIALRSAGVRMANIPVRALIGAFAGDDAAAHPGPAMPGAGPGPSGPAFAPPASNICTGAVAIPSEGPFPHTTVLIPDITDATVAGDPAGAPSCAFGGGPVSRSVWFRLNPSTTASYTFSTCSGAPTGTTIEDTVVAIFGSSGGCSGPFTELACDDDGCGIGFQSSVTATLERGTNYFIVVWKFGASAPAEGHTAVQLRVDAAPVPETPANDRCQEAETIPPDGPFPHLTSIVPSSALATSDGDPPVPSCQEDVSGSVWYRFAPAASGRYVFSTCADATATTVEDTVLGVYEDAGSMLNGAAFAARGLDGAAIAAPGTDVAGGPTDLCVGALREVEGGCDDDSCGSRALQAVVAADLEAGRSYAIVAWRFSGAPPRPGRSALQLRVSRSSPAVNDRCEEAAPLLLDRPVRGTTETAADDYELAAAGCFEGIGQSPSQARGRDVSFVFDAPASGEYSFRVLHDGPGNPVLYLADRCPAGPSPVLLEGSPPCVAASNRSNHDVEEIACAPLSAGQRVFVFVDDTALGSGGPFTLEATSCLSEAEPNDAPETATTARCGEEGTIGTAGDVDFYALGAPPSGSRVFALVDGAAAGSPDFDLRVTTAEGTLEYDDFNAGDRFGGVSAAIGGTRTPGGDAFLRVSHSSAAERSGPYRLYSVVQCEPSAAAEVEPNDAPSQAGPPDRDYYSGALAGPPPSTDADVYALGEAAAGELIVLGLDGDPDFDGTCTNGKLEILDASGEPRMVVNDGGATSNARTPVAGDLAATGPSSCAEALTYRPSESGVLFARVSAGTASTGGSGAGTYLLSIARECVARCDDGDACTVGETCGSGTCGGGGPVDCDDQDVCTDDGCVPPSGCVHTHNTASCSDGNGCTAGDVCQAGTCASGSSLFCDDGNICTENGCDPSVGCRFTNNHTCGSKGKAYWKKLCRGPQGGDEYTQLDVDCVSETCTFASVRTIADLCARLDPPPPQDRCERAEVGLMTLALNLCRGRVLPGETLGTTCRPRPTAEQALGNADAVLCNPDRRRRECGRAECFASGPGR